MSNKNMNIWDQVQKSDPASIKEVSYGRKFNAINAQHQVKRATEIFGPLGSGWGINNEAYSMIIPGLMLYQGIMWWSEGDHVYHFPISSSIATHSNSGKLDDECVKKCQTDAITKGLSRLGFNADIFLGLWDDSRYVNRVKEEVAASTTADQQKEMDEKLEALKIKAKNVLVSAKELAEAGDPEGIMGLWNANKDFHPVRGFKTNITKFGLQAKEVKAANETKFEDGKEA